MKNKPCKAYHAPFDVRLPDNSTTDDDINTVVQPDLAVVCDTSKLDTRGCLGAPNFIIEIISPSTAAKDRMTKTALYEKHGVAEYWIIHPFDRLLTIRTLDDEKHYPAPRMMELKGSVAVESVPGLEIDFETVGALCEEAAADS